MQISPKKNFGTSRKLVKHLNHFHPKRYLEKIMEQASTIFNCSQGTRASNNNVTKVEGSQHRFLTNLELRISGNCYNRLQTDVPLTGPFSNKRVSHTFRSKVWESKCQHTTCCLVNLKQHPYDYSPLQISPSPENPVLHRHFLSVSKPFLGVTQTAL